MHLVWHLPDCLPAAKDMQRMGQAAGVGLYTLNTGHAYSFAGYERADRVLMLGYPSVPETRIRRGIQNLAAFIGSSRGKAG